MLLHGADSKALVHVYSLSIVQVRAEGWAPFPQPSIDKRTIPSSENAAAMRAITHCSP